MIDEPVSPAPRRRQGRGSERGFLYRGIRIVPSFIDERSAQIEAGMREVAVRLGIVAGGGRSG